MAYQQRTKQNLSGQLRYADWQGAELQDAYFSVAGNLAQDNLPEILSQPSQQDGFFLPYEEELQQRQKAERKLREDAARKERLVALQRQSVFARRKKIAYAICCLAIFSIVFGGLMLRQAKIYEQNFSNTALRKKITEQKENNADLANRLVSRSDSAYIEKEALRLYGLRRPSQMQRIVVELPPSDKLVYYEQQNTKGEKEQVVSNNYQVLEAYMKAFGLAHAK